MLYFLFTFRCLQCFISLLQCVVFILCIICIIVPKPAIGSGRVWVFLDLGPEYAWGVAFGLGSSMTTHNIFKDTLKNSGILQVCHERGKLSKETKAHL